MANLNAAIHRVRRARRRVEEVPAGEFDDYRSTYETILATTEELAGEPAFDDLVEWIIETTEDRRRLPELDAVRRRARDRLAERGVSVPDDSPLRE